MNQRVDLRNFSLIFFSRKKIFHDSLNLNDFFSYFKKNYLQNTHSIIVIIRIALYNVREEEGKQEVQPFKPFQRRHQLEVEEIYWNSLFPSLSLFFVQISSSSSFNLINNIKEEKTAAKAADSHEIIKSRHICSLSKQPLFIGTL